MSPLMLGLVIFVLLAIAVICVSAALSERHNAFEERLSEMGARMRVSYGAMDAEEIESASVAHVLFRCFEALCKSCSSTKMSSWV